MGMIVRKFTLSLPLIFSLSVLNCNKKLNSTAHLLHLCEDLTTF